MPSFSRFMLVWNQKMITKHVFLSLPIDFVNWLLLFIGISLVVLFYFVHPQTKTKSDQQQVKITWVLIFCGLVPFIGLLIEVLGFTQTPFTSTAFDASIILRLLPVGVPILFSAIYLPYRKGYWIILGISLFNSLVITHTPFTILESVILLMLASYIYADLQRTRLKDYLVRALHLIIMTTPFVFFVSLLLYPSTLAVRFDYSFTMGWFRWLGYVFSFLLSAVIIWGFHQWGGDGANRKNENTIMRVMSKRFSRSFILFSVVTLFLISISAFWFFQRQSLLQKIKGGVDGILDSFTVDYAYFYDLGKTLVQSSAEEISKSSSDQYAQLLDDQINHVPFFSSLHLIKAGGILVQHPETGELLTSDELSAACAGVNPDRSSVSLLRRLDATLYLFASGVDMDTCLVGVTSLGFSPQLNQYGKLLDSFSTFWQMEDEFGAIYASQPGRFIFSDQMPDEHIYDDGFVVKNESTEHAPVKVNFYIEYELTAIADAIAANGLSPYLILTFIYLALLALLLYFNADVQNRMAFILQGISALQNYDFETIFSREVKDSWFGLDEQIQQLSNLMKTQVNYLQRGLEIVDLINEADSFTAVKEIIYRENFLKEIGKMNLLIDPELNLIGKSEDTLAGPSQYKALAVRAEKEDYRPFVLKTQTQQINAEALQSTIYSLRYHDQLIGFLVVTNAINTSLRPYQERFLFTFSSLLAGGIVNRLRRSMESIENERIDFLIRAYPEPLFVVGRDTNLVVLNKAAKDLPGVVAELAESGVPLRRFVREASLLTELEKAGREELLSKRLLLSDGHEYLINTVSSDDHLESVERWTLIVMQDITHYKQNEQIRSELFESVAQYLQMPIKMTRGNLKMLSMVGPLNESQKSYAQHMEESIDDIDSFVSQMLERNRLENPTNFDMQVVDLDQLLHGVVDRIIPYTKQQNVFLYLEKKAGFQTRQIECDAQLFAQAIYNLLENSVYNNHVGGEVHLTVEERLGDFIICIADTGPGISAVDINRIFTDPTVLELQGKSSRTSMGLPLVKSIVERHKGEIWVKSKLGKGSQFYIRIPRSTSA